MTATAETLLDFIKSNPNPMRLAENFKMVGEAYEDLLHRVVYLEKSYLAQHFSQQQLDDRIAKVETTLHNYDADHAEVKKNMELATKEPTRSAERLDKIEERLRAVEGATGQRVKEDRDATHPDKPAPSSLNPFTPAQPAEKTPQPA